MKQSEERDASAMLKPTLREVWLKWFDAVNPAKGFNRYIPALYAMHHLVSCGVFVYFVIHYSSVPFILSVIALSGFMATVYNTIWYHRYCSHQAFKFRSLWFARLFLWTNPTLFREESYVIPHRIHHAKSDKPGDPYGPHLGWLGSYLTAESQQILSRDITPEEYDRMASSLAHVGFVRNSYEQFRRTGSVENVWHYGARVLVINLVWMVPAYFIAGWPGVLAFVSATFLFTFILRDFNFRGHSNWLGVAKISRPVNQVIYGLLAGEWHENHHAKPRLAVSGFRWWQVDLPYSIIRLMKMCGVVTRVNSPSTKG